MKNKILGILIVMFWYSNTHAQIRELSEKVLYNKADTSLSIKEKNEMNALWKNLKFYRDYEDIENKMNGKVSFSFEGNESDLTKKYNNSAGIEIDNGTYPFELDLKAKFQSTILNGVFQENVSDIDISFDYHPNLGEGLTWETYTLLARFKNNFIGIDQRYETGLGLILNYYTKDDLTLKGRKKVASLMEVPMYYLKENDLWRKDSTESKISDSSSRKLFLNKEDIENINNARKHYSNANIKKHAKLRLAMLVGIYHEIEKARLQRQILFNSVDTLFDQEFEATNKLRWVLRPTLVYRPDDVFTFKIYPYIKLPLEKWDDVVEYNANTVIKDKRDDVFFDFQASISAKVSDMISVGINYRFLKDFAPKRDYVLNDQGVPELIVGQETNSYYNVSFSYKF